MSKKSQFGMTLLLSTILVGGANASTVSTSNTLGAAMIAQQGDVSGEEGAVWDDEVVAQALSEFLLALCQDDAGHLGLQFLQLIIEVKGSDNFT